MTRFSLSKFSLSKFSLSKFSLSKFSMLVLLPFMLAGHVGAQNPGAITTTPIEWLRADSITAQADGSAVTSWAAKSGQAVSQATASLQPVYHSAGPNSQPYVTFAGGRALYTTALNQASGSYTIFGVVRIPDTGNASANTHWLFDSQTGRLVAYPYNPVNGGGGGGGWYDGAFNNTAVTAGFVGAWAVYSWVFDSAAGTGKMYVNGNVVATGTYSPKALGGITAIGNPEDVAAGAVAGTGGVGDDAETIVFGAALSTADLASVTNYLTARYITAVVSIAPNNAGIIYSPYNWLVAAGSAKTINAGAYFRTLAAASATCKVGLTIGTATPYSEVYARLDGGTWQQYTPTVSGAQVWTLAMPSPSTAPNHLLEFLVKSTTETQDRWTAQTTAVQFTGLTLDAGASVSAPALRKYRVLVFGDSITEGVRVNGFTGITNDTDRNDNTLDYSYRFAELLDAEVGVVGFGGTGMTVAGSGNVPALPSAYSLLWSGQARTFTPVPDLVIYNEGTNDSAAVLSALQTAFSTVINGIGYTGTGNTFAGLNGTRHLVLRPFNGSQAANLSSIAAGFSSANIVYGNTTGFWTSADSSDGTHPYAYAHLGSIAPSAASLALPLLRNAAGGTKRRTQ